MHHQIVLATGRPEPLAFNPINQIPFEADSLATLVEFHRRCIAEGLEEIVPVTHGNALSCYVQDPEGNRLEVFMDTRWYVDQPMRVPVDCNPSDTKLLAVVKANFRTLPGFRPRCEWGKEMATCMGIAT